MKSTIPASLALAIAGFALSGCGGGASDTEQAAPEGFPGITVSDGRLVLPAVEGNPGAVYFSVDYTGDDIAAIRAASVEGARSAELHNTVDGTMSRLASVNVEKGTTVKFEPGGMHVMVMGLPDTMKAGDTANVTLTFLGGDKFSFPAKVEAAGSEN